MARRGSRRGFGRTRELQGAVRAAPQRGAPGWRATAAHAGDAGERPGVYNAAPMAHAKNPPPPEKALFSPAYTWYVVGVCCLVYTVNFVDRNILSILMPAIEEDLQLDDTQLGALSTAFGLFYATLALPIGRIADRRSRRDVIAICIAAWSAMTVLCGWARGFWDLFAYRIGVGIGEAGGSPPSISLISDTVPPQWRATALALFSMGVPLGVVIGLLAGGYLREELGWRYAFFVVGAPGLAVAVLVWATVREPPRAPAPVMPPVSAVLHELWRRRSFRQLAIASGLYAFAGYSSLTWLPTFLGRSHGLGAVEQAHTGALIAAVGVGIGTFLGGPVADIWARRDRRAYVLLPMITMLLAVPWSIAAYLSEDRFWATLFLMFPSLLGQMYQAPAFAAAQSLAPAKMRVLATAVLFCVINLIGLTLGPLATGMLSDRLAPEYGEESLRYALLVVNAVFFAWASLHFGLAARSLRQDFDEVARQA